MFKKKANIPPRPSPPGISQLQADLDNSDSDDIIFKRNLLRLEYFLNETVNSEDNSGRDENDEEKVYLRVKDFVQTNSLIYEYVKTLEEEGETLQFCNAELKRIAQEIRKQAQQALK